MCVASATDESCLRIAGDGLLWKRDDITRENQWLTSAPARSVHGSRKDDAERMSSLRQR